MLVIYSVFMLAAAGTTMPLDPDGFMPFQHNYLLWKIVGFAGLGIFQARWVVQWLYSEKHKESMVPPIFWWLSLVGAMLELSYFLRQQDSVGVAGYCVSAVPYTRNLMLVYGKKKREQRGFVPLPLDEKTSKG
ncbi:MAG TPA: lipid-A-disaccharide synthase N-terminal domain-containing protein [Tepidisphaeraceae bacterium]